MVEPWPSVADAYVMVGHKFHVEPARDEIVRRFAEAWSKQESIDAAGSCPFATSQVRERERWRCIVDDVFDHAPQSGLIFENLWKHFGSPSSWRSLPYGEALMEKAILKGCGIALASNFDERLITIAQALSPLNKASHVFASSELGWRKPAIEFFRAVEQRLNARPDELAMVGDDDRLDIAAAVRAGWRGIPVTSTGDP